MYKKVVHSGTVNIPIGDTAEIVIQCMRCHSDMYLKISNLPPKAKPLSTTTFPRAELPRTMFPNSVYEKEEIPYRPTLKKKFYWIAFFLGLIAGAIAIGVWTASMLSY